jgi:hypothetical protein
VNCPAARVRIERNTDPQELLMTEQPPPSFFVRLFLGLAVYWRFLVDGQFAARVQRLRLGEVTAPEKPAPPTLKEAPADAALQLLGLLQQEGRFVDFIEEDVASFSDVEVGAAVRVVHEGCRKTLREHFVIEPVRAEQEGSRLTVEQGFDAGSLRLTGNVVGNPPFSGTLVHRGWRVAETRLPKIAQGHNLHVIAPAEVEL